MKRFFLGTSVALLGIVATSAYADVRELARTELRENVRSGQSMSLRQLKAVVAKRVQGELVDVRAFEAEGVVYRILVKKPDGTLAAAVVDARTGRFLSSRSEVVKDVMAAAKSNNGKAKGAKISSYNGAPLHVIALVVLLYIYKPRKSV